MRKRSYSFPWQWAWTVALISLIIGLPTLLWLHQTLDAQTSSERQRLLQAWAHTAAMALHHDLRDRLAEVEQLAASPELVSEPLDSPEVRVLLDRWHSRDKVIAWAGVADLQGRVRNAAGGVLDGQSVGARPWFTQAQSAAHVGGVHEAVLLAKLLAVPGDQYPLRFFDVAVPVLDDKRQPRGVLGVHGHWAWAEQILSRVASNVPPSASLSVNDFWIVGPGSELLYPADDRTNTLSNLASARDQVLARAPVPEVNAESRLGWSVVVRQRDAGWLGDDASVWLTVTAAGGLWLVSVIGLLWRWTSRMQLAAADLASAAHRAARGESSLTSARPGVMPGFSGWQELTLAVDELSATAANGRQALAALQADLVGQIAQRTAQLEQANAVLLSDARHDALTGLPNRRSADERLVLEFRRERRMGHPYAVILLDVDHFKRVNDTFGHDAGDQVLRRVAQTLQEHIRETDFVARVGGEEFLVILPVTPLADALRVADKLRAAVAEQAIEPVGHVTISLGVCPSSPLDPDPHRAVTLADQQLYASKQGGRNRVSWVTTDRSVCPSV